MHEAATAGLACEAVATGDHTTLRDALAAAGLPVEDGTFSHLG